MDNRKFFEFGMFEFAGIVAGTILAASLSLGFLLPPPWWCLPTSLRAARFVDVEIEGGWRWKDYEFEGGYDQFWLQSLWGWMIVGAVIGLIISNAVVRKLYERN